MRASRLLSVLLLLQTRGRMTAPELAQALEVSVRTVYRDVEALEQAGVPLFAERGPAGGYELLDGYRTRLTGMSTPEAESLFLAGAPGPAAELGLGQVLDTAQLKLLAALPPEPRARAERLRTRFHLDPAPWFREIGPAPFLPVVAGAVWEQRRIRVRYRRWSGEVERVLEPLGIVLKAGVWYMCAAIDGQVRTYRVSQILEIETLTETFERPEGFDLAGEWAGYVEQFEREVHRDRVRVRITERGLALAANLLGAAPARLLRESAGLPEADGWMPAELLVESLEQAARDLLRFGADLEVVQPEGLRERIRRTVVELAALYAEETGARPAPGVTGAR